MAEWTAYKNRPKLLDVVVSGLAANTTGLNCSNGNVTSGASIVKLTNPNITGIVPSGRVWDALLVVATPVIGAALALPDCSIWFTNGSATQQAYQVFDVSYQANMIPTFPRMAFNPEVPQAALLLGRSSRDVLRENSARMNAGGGAIPNLPSLITGYKVGDSLTLYVASKAGWTNPIVPLRVRVYGDVLSSSDLAELADLPYPGDVTWDVPPTERFQAEHSWPNRGTVDGWTSGPGGPAQSGSLRLNRRIVYGYNAKLATGLYVMSAKNGVTGAVGNSSSGDTSESTTYYDLGEVYTASSKSAVFIDRFGCNLYAGGTDAYVAWQVNGQPVPQETTQGMYITSTQNRLAYGAASTAGTGGTKFLTLPNVDNVARVLMYKNAVAPIFQPGPLDGSAGLAAGDVSVAYAGTKAEVS